MTSVSPSDLAIPVPQGHISAPAKAPPSPPAVPPAPLPSCAATFQQCCAPSSFNGHENEKLRCLSRLHIADLLLRSCTVAFLVVALSSMLTSSQRTSVQILGFTISVSMKWTRSQPFEFLVVVEALICAYAAAQFLYQSVVFAKKAAPCRRSKWIQLIADQLCAYLVLSAAAADAGASRMNRAAFQTQLGVQSLHIPTVCSVIDKFCSKATIAIVFTLLAAFTSAVSTALDVYIISLC